MTKRLIPHKNLTPDAVKVIPKLIKILREDDEITLRMEAFISGSELVKDYNPYECGTSCCVAGLIPLVAKGLANKHTITRTSKKTGEVFEFYDFEKMSNKLVKTYRQWDFLFDSLWGNDKEHAIKRLEYYYTHGSVPRGWDYEWGEDND